MEDTFVKLIGDLVASIGIPGALLMVLAWSWIKAQPQVFQFLTGTNESLKQIATCMGGLATKQDVGELRNDVRDIKERLIN